MLGGLKWAIFGSEMERMRLDQNGLSPLWNLNRNPIEKLIDQMYFQNAASEGTNHE